MIEIGMKSSNDMTPIAADTKRVQLPTVIFSLLVTLIGFCLYAAWTVSGFRSQMTTDMGWVKSSLSTLVTRFNELDVMQSQMKAMDKDGTQAFKELALKAQSLAQKVDAYEKYGSPANVKSMENFEGRLSRLENEFSTYKATDNGKGSKQ